MTASAALRRHRGCPLVAMRYDDHGATCTSCELRWMRDGYGYRLVALRPAWAASL